LETPSIDCAARGPIFLSVINALKGHTKYKIKAGVDMRMQILFGLRKRKLILPIISLIAVMTGCTVYYTQPGKSTADFNRDKKYCEGVAEREYIRNSTRLCDEVDRCLVNTKGWKRD
jgi:hypothetical protein